MCNGNCNQGRNCDCMPVQFAKGKEDLPSDSFDGAVIGMAILICCIFSIGYLAGKVFG